MTIHTRRRTNPVPVHAYTVPIVREILLSTAASSAAPDPLSFEHATADASA